jgi:hypothetical protein
MDKMHGAIHMEICSLPSHFSMFSNKPPYTSKRQSSAFPKIHSDKSTDFHDKNV